jgi:transcriptional regulator with XRE-family HTH domain
VTVGAQLAEARRQRGLSVADIAQRTKISVAAVRTIERDDMKDLPGGIVTRGFLRAYAREVGCDPEAIVRRYRETFEPGTAGATAGRDQKSGIGTSCAAGQLHVADIDAAERQRSRAAYLGGIAVLVGGIGSCLFIHKDFRGKVLTSAVADTMAVAAPQSPDPSLVEKGTAGSASAERAIDLAIEPRPTEESRPTGLQLDLEPQGLCWVSATADKQTLVYRNMNSGEHARIDANDEIVLRVGDAASFRFSINGTAARQLGTAGQAVTLHITPQNYQQFLER